MNGTATEKSDIEIAEDKLKEMKLSIDRLKGLGVDTTQLEGTYNFLKTQIGFIKQS